MTLNIKTSILNYNNQKDGLYIDLIFNIGEHVFYGIVVYNPKFGIVVDADDNFLKLFGVELFEDLPFHTEMMEEISYILPDEADLLKMFNKKKKK